MPYTPPQLAKGSHTEASSMYIPMTAITHMHTGQPELQVFCTTIMPWDAPSSRPSED